MENNQLKEILIAQRGFYSFLSKLITLGPQKELLNRFYSAYVNIVEIHENEKDMLLQGINTIHKALGEQTLKFKETALMSEYTRLFIGPGKIPVPPYASVYLSDELKPKLMDDNTIEVRKQYLQDNIIMTNLNNVPDDYLGAELEYILYLTNRSIESIENRNDEELHIFIEKQLNFMRNHLLTWIPKFSDNLIALTNEDFYRGVGLLLKGLIISHANILRGCSDAE